MTGRCIVGDNRLILPTLEAGSVQTCVTSPPYWGLRDYGTARWEGGDADCDHTGDQRYYTEKSAGAASSEAFTEAGPENAERLKKARWREQGTCTKCGAVKIDSQLGLEKTPEEYVANMVQVFREVKRVLRDDGTLWLNLGDSYATNGGAHGGLKPKNLIGIPWRAAFALQADGWYLRQDIIWSKPNPMPESVTDRCTKAHEYIFLLSKSARYYFDADAIAEPLAEVTLNDARVGRDVSRGGIKDYETAGVQNPSHVRANIFNNLGTTRNKRSVWTVTTKPFSGAHFATFPPDLIEPCILAGSKLGDTVLDPFGGSGTTGMVAESLGRNWVLIELNPEYEKLSRDRTAQMGMTFT
jgi:DNA modification methylase